MEFPHLDFFEIAEKAIREHLRKQLRAGFPATFWLRPLTLKPVEGHQRSMQSTSTPLTLVDLFAGCGGLSLGMEQAGFIPVFVNELSPDAMESYLLNRRHLLNGKPFNEHGELHCHDANDLDADRLAELVQNLENLEGMGLKFNGDNGSTLDLLAGGPPCQGFSGLGHRRSYSVDKEKLPSNQLYKQMALIIEHLRPRIFLFENVQGLLTSRWTEGGTKGEIWRDVRERFREIPGYHIRYSLVRASDYGVPQNRPRVLLVGVRKDVAEDNPALNLLADSDDAVKCGFLPPGEPSNCPNLEELLGDLVDPVIDDVLKTGSRAIARLETAEYPSPPQNALQQKLRTDPSGRPAELTDQVYSRHEARIVAKFVQMRANGGLVPEWARTKKFSQRVLPPTWGNQRPSITATSMPDDYVHFSQPRTLTVREWARLQMFPDWYQFGGKRTTGGLRRAGNPREGNFDRETPKYTQIGNAVPVALAEQVGLNFRAILASAVDRDAPVEVEFAE